MSVEVDDFDWKTAEVLQTLAILDGSATTTEIREHSAVETNQDILYRVDEKLEPRGYVTSFQPSSDKPLVPPKQIELTTEGKQIVEKLRENQDNEPKLEDIPTKIEQLTGQLNQTQSRIDDLEAQLTETEDEAKPVSISEYSNEFADLRNRLQCQQEQLTRLEQRLDTFEEQAMGAWSAEKQEEFETLWNAMLAMRRFLEQEVEPNAEGTLQDYR